MNIQRTLPLFTILIALLWSSNLQADEVKPAASRSQISNFSLKDIRGRLINLDRYKKKVVVISFWATWCGPCLKELPHLDKLYKEYKDKGLAVLAISTDSQQTSAQVARYARRWKLTTLLDPEGKVVAKLNPRSTAPYTLILDHDRGLAYQHSGYTKGDEVKIKEVVLQLLKERKQAGITP